MVTRRLRLTAEQMEVSGCNNDDAGACLFVYAVGVPVVSLVASGSIVLIGNTLHWLEFHGGCDEGFIHQATAKFRDQQRPEEQQQSDDSGADDDEDYREENGGKKAPLATTDPQ